MANQRGEMLYSAVACLRPGETFLLENNPEQGGPNNSIEENFKYSLERTNNDWIDEKWAREGQPSTLQLRMW